MNLDDPLIWLRAVHFAATATATGLTFFLVFIADPAFRRAPSDAAAPIARLRMRLVWTGWIGILLCVASGALWLIVLAGRMSDRPLTEVVTENVTWTVVFQTQFGTASALRLACAVLLAVLLLPLATAR